MQPAPVLQTGAHAAQPPQNVADLWSAFDPRKEPLEVELVREWKEDGGIYRYVRYRIGTFKGHPSRMAAFYGFPEGTKSQLPAVMHMHGGGQRAGDVGLFNRTLGFESYAPLNHCPVLHLSGTNDFHGWMVTFTAPTP